MPNSVSTFVFTACLVLVVACAGSGDDDSNQPSATNPASCEAMVDHLIAECPDDAPGRLFEIELCEDQRAHEEPIGCGKALAGLVLCRTHASTDCETGEPAGCDDEQLELARCRQAFAAGTLCTRIAAQDAIACGGERFAFGCLGDVPKGCEPATTGNSVCCESFGKGGSYFVDPMLSDDELPPDYSDVDFTDLAQCLDFGTEQAWGTCDESVGCACMHCSAELAACASEHSCLFIRGCDVGANDCDPNDDPFFTGYGGGADKADALEACMTGAGCALECL